MDASILVPLFLNDPFSQRAEDFLTLRKPLAIVSDSAAAEFSSVLNRRVRTKESTEAEARSALQAFDRWIGNTAQFTECEPADLRQANRFLRRLDLPLRTPDAIHIATAQRTGAELATFDLQMVASARALGVAVAPA
jgi:predicted nucleic acid-binding protein